MDVGNRRVNSWPSSWKGCVLGQSTLPSTPGLSLVPKATGTPPLFTHPPPLPPPKGTEGSPRWPNMPRPNLESLQDPLQTSCPFGPINTSAWSEQMFQCGVRKIRSLVCAFTSERNQQHVQFRVVKYSEPGCGESLAAMLNAGGGPSAGPGQTHCFGSWVTGRRDTETGSGAQRPS